MIPLSLITGFLGSGKTTFLKRIAAQNRQRRIVYLVNEFSPLDVDGHLLRADTEDLVALPGGSIFCTCLVTSFIATLNDIPKKFRADEELDGATSTPTMLTSTSNPLAPSQGARLRAPDGLSPSQGARLRAPDGLVIEASGIANPKVVEHMLHETQLDRVYQLASVICIVDPGTFPKLLQALPNTVAQVESADIVILNKTDLFDDDTLRRAEDQIRRIRPDAQILRAVHCDVTIDLFNPRPERGLQGEYASCADPHFARFTVHLPRNVDLQQLRRTIEAAHNIIYRLKGFVLSGDTPYYIDATPTTLTMNATPSTPSSPPGLALVTPANAYQQARDFVTRLQDTQLP